MRPNLPKNLDFLPPKTTEDRVEAIKDKAPEITILRKQGLSLIKQLDKKMYQPSSEERAWIFYDSLITTTKADFADYISIYGEKLTNGYPWELVNWLKKWYTLWRYLRFTIHIKLEIDDGILFHTLARPFPPGFCPPDYKTQDLSFYYIIAFHYTLTRYAKKKEVIKEIYNNKELLTKLIRGDILPLQYTEIVPFAQLYESIIKKLLKDPSKVGSLPPETQKSIEISSGLLDIKVEASQDMQKPCYKSLFLQMLEAQKEGKEITFI